MAGIIDLDIDPTPWCPICGDTGEVEDDEGFVTDCTCGPENDEPWIVPASADHAHLPRLGLDALPSVGVQLH